MNIRTRGQQILLSIAALGSAAAIAGMGTFASWSDTDTAAQAVASGTVDVAVGAAGGAAGDANNRLTVGVSGMAPGDTAQRAFKLRNPGTLDLASISLSTASASNTALYNALLVTIDSCSIAWVEGGTAPAYTYTCLGTTSSVLSQRSVVIDAGSPAALGNLTTTAGATNNLRLTLELPSSNTGSSAQGNTDTITYTFSGTQRNATAK